MTSDPNRDRLIAVAQRLGPLIDDVVFVGGTVTGLLIHAPAPRLTKDVDLVAPVDSAVAYENDVACVLRAHGWSEDDSEDAPRCRWRHRDAGIADVMSRVDAGFGFSNPWYPGALAHAEPVTLTPDLTVKVVSVPYFLAIRPEAMLELRDAAEWYENEREGLGAELIEGFEQTLDAALQDPNIVVVVAPNASVLA